MRVRALLPVAALVALVVLVWVWGRERGPERPLSTRNPPPGLAWPDSLPERGRWWPSDPREAPRSAAERETRERLLGLGYVSGSQPAPARSGVQRHDRERVQPGLNLYVSGHAPEAVLSDLDGNVIHRWSHEFRDAFPGYPVPGGSRGVDSWRRAVLLPGGDLLAVYEGFGLVRLDRDSNRIWANPARFHHDLDVTVDGTIWGLIRQARVLPRIHPREPVLEDYLVTLDSAGRITRQISLLSAFETSPFRGLLREMPASGDLFHTNTVEVIREPGSARHPAFQPGNVLVSLLTLDVVAVVDPRTETVVWATRGPWRAQHEPGLTPEGNLLVFDNRGHPAGSRILEVDPLTLDVVWSYEGEEGNGFYTFDCGSCRRLGNGNTLITESNDGRAFEVTPAGEIVWEFQSPHRAGEGNRLVATLFDVVRLEGWEEPEWASSP